MPSTTPCWYCQHLTSIDARSRIATCEPVGWTVHSGGECSRYEREPGVDDDGWELGRSTIARYVPESPAAPPNRGRDAWWTEPPRPRRIAPPSQVVPILVPVRDPFGGLFNWND